MITLLLDDLETSNKMEMKAEILNFSYTNSQLSMKRGIRIRAISKFYADLPQLKKTVSLSKMLFFQ